jgi:hypothetical protein
MAAGPHPRRELTLTPHLPPSLFGPTASYGVTGGFTVLGAVWPQALLLVALRLHLVAN